LYQAVLLQNSSNKAPLIPPIIVRIQRAIGQSTVYSTA